MFEKEFIDYLKFEKRYSKNTIVAYEKDLSQFSTYISSTFDTKNIKQVTFQMIRSWIIEIMDSGTSSRSVNRKLSTLKTYYRYLIKEGIVDENPMIKVQSPKTVKKLPVYVEETKMELLLTESLFPDNFEGKRDRLIIEMFYQTGMRLSELVNLNDNDFDFHNQTIKVLGKRNKERLIPLTRYLSTLIKDYMVERGKIVENNEQNNYFFVTIKGKKIYKKLVYRIVNSYLSSVSTIQKRSPHVLRHTFATHMLNNGADLNAIKEILGHANLAATQVYTHNTIEKLKNIYKQAHPRA